MTYANKIKSSGVSIVMAAAAAVAGCALDTAGEPIATEEEPLTQGQRESMISTKFGQNTGLLGSPLGGYTHFTNGAKRDFTGASNNSSIYVGDAVNRAHIVMGLIRSAYLGTGAQGGVLGYPTTDELPTGFNTGRYNWFQFGRILWKNGASAAFETHGTHDSQYIRLGVEWGHLGFPTSNQVAITGKQKNNFEFGRIYSTSSSVWPVLTDTNPNNKLSTMGWPRISGTITPTGSVGGGCIHVQGSSFPAGKTVTVHAADSQGLKGGEAAPVVVSSSGTFSYDETTFCSSGLRKNNGRTTLVAKYDAAIQAVTATLFSNGFAETLP